MRAQKKNAGQKRLISSYYTLFLKFIAIIKSGKKGTFNATPIHSSTPNNVLFIFLAFCSLTKKTGQSMLGKSVAMLLLYPCLL